MSFGEGGIKTLLREPVLARAGQEEAGCSPSPCAPATFGCPPPGSIICSSQVFGKGPHLKTGSPESTSPHYNSAAAVSWAWPPSEPSGSVAVLMRSWLVTQGRPPSPVSHSRGANEREGSWGGCGEEGACCCLVQGPQNLQLLG